MPEDYIDIILTPENPTEDDFLKKLSRDIAREAVELEQTLMTGEETGKLNIYRMSVRLSVAWRTKLPPSPCCNAGIHAYDSRVDLKISETYFLVGVCSKCKKQISRQNPETGKQEWLDGKSALTEEALRPLEYVWY